MRTRTRIIALLAIFISLAPMSAIPAYARPTWTATFTGNITGVVSLSRHGSKWVGSSATLTFNPVSDTFWDYNVLDGGSAEGLHSDCNVYLTCSYKEGVVTIYIDYGYDAAGHYRLSGSGTITGGHTAYNIESSGQYAINYLDQYGAYTHWRGYPIFSIDIVRS